MAANFRYGDVLKQYEDSQSSGDICKWLEKVEMIVALQKIEKKEVFLPMFLAGQALDVFMELTDEEKKDYNKVAETLTTAFAPSPFTAYEELQRRSYRSGESVDAFVADLRRLFHRAGASTPSDQLLKSAFVSGLPQQVRRQLLAMADATVLSVSELMSRARVALSVGESEVACAAGGRGTSVGIRCYKCNKLGHRMSECRSGSTAPQFPRPKTPVRCFGCHELGHPIRLCPKLLGNERGETSSVPEVSPSQ